MESHSLICRNCSQPLTEKAAIYLGANNKRTTSPACRDCYEWIVAKGVREDLSYRDGRQRNPGYQTNIYNGSYTE